MSFVWNIYYSKGGGVVRKDGVGR